MASDYTIIMWVRHRFGDAKDDPGEQDEDFQAPFVGAAGEFPFSCPNIDTSQGAILQFEYRGSEQFLTFPDPHGNPKNLVGITEEHPVKINGQLLAGGVPAAPQRGQMEMWSTRVLLIDPGVLRRENVLQIETGAISTSTNPNLDNFTIDNVVVFYKTGSTHVPPVEA